MKTDEEVIEEARQHVLQAISLFIEYDIRSEYIDEAIANLEDAEYYLTKEIKV